MAGYWANRTNERVSRRRLIGAAGTLSLGAGALALIGCSSDDTTNTGTAGSPTSTTRGEPKPGGTYSSYFSNMGNYNVTSFFHDAYGNSGITAYDRPITYRRDSKGYHLEAAAKIEIAEPTRIVMTLKPDMVFQNKAPVNGRKVLASDIVAVQNYIKQAPNAYLSNFQRTFIDRVEAPDDLTVVWHFKTPYAYTFAATGFGEPSSQSIIPKELLDVLDTTPAIGSGPFELVDHTFSQKYVYKKFENFREAKNGMPYFTNRETYGITDPVAQEAAFRSGQLTEWTPAASAVDRLMTELDPKRYSNSQFLATGQVSLNAMTNVSMGGARPWNDIRFREAVYRLFNKEQIATLVYGAKAVANTTPLHANLDAWLMDAKVAEPYYKEDVAKAKQLLSAMSYDESKEWEFIISNTTNTNATLAEVVQSQLARGGIRTRVTALPLAEILPKRMGPSQFDMWLGGQPGGDTPARFGRQQHSNVNDQFGNIGLYDPQVDALVEKSEVATDREENIKLIKELQKKVLDLYGLNYNIITQQSTIFHDSRLQDFIIDPVSGQDYQYQAWFA